MEAAPQQQPVLLLRGSRWDVSDLCTEGQLVFGHKLTVEEAGYTPISDVESHEARTGLRVWDSVRSSLLRPSSTLSVHSLLHS